MVLDEFKWSHLSCHYGMLQQHQLGGTSLSPLPALTKFKFSDDIHTHTYTRTHAGMHARITFLSFFGCSFPFLIVSSLFNAASTIRFGFTTMKMQPCKFFSQTTQSNVSQTDRPVAAVAVAA